MPRTRLAVTDFSKGIIKRSDAEDIPDNAASDSNNIDGDAENGMLKAIPTSATKSLGTTTLVSGRLFDWIKTKDAKWNLVYADNAYLNLVTDFYGASPASYFGATAIATTATSMVAHNEEIRVANGTTSGVPTSPTWIGNCDFARFGTVPTAGTTWQYAPAGISKPTYTTDYTLAITGHAGTGSFVTDVQYQYALSFVYDGIQESPLCTTYATWVGSTVDYVTISVTLETVSNLNLRITGIKLYRREADLFGSPTTLFRLLQDISVVNSVGFNGKKIVTGTLTYGQDVSWATSGVDKVLDVIDNNADLLSSYEEQAGITETLTTSDVYYALNCDLNAYHFVAQCAKTGIPEAAFMMYRSIQYRYDMFDWINVYLKLPTIPTALKAFNGKIWAFDENNIYRINPDGLYIEDITTGIGCLSQRSITITDYGMFWCDYKNAYWHDGEQIRPIGNVIRTTPTSTYDWMGFAKSYTVGQQGLTPIVVFNSIKNYVMFIEPDHSGGYTNVWAFHIPLERWDKWLQFTTCGNASTGNGAFVGRNGEVYISNGTTLEEPLGGTGFRAFYWVSKIFDFGKTALNKVFYKLTADLTSLTSAPTFTYGKNRATPTSSLTTGEFKSGGEYEVGKQLQLKVTEATGYGNSVYSFEVLLRSLFEL